MCNCGGKRNEYTTAQQQSPTSHQGLPAQGKKMWPGIYFKYTGHTALTVTGKMTGKNYRFSKPGETALIDYRDAPGMMMIPILRKLAAE